MSDELGLATPNVGQDGCCLAQRRGGVYPLPRTGANRHSRAGVNPAAYGWGDPSCLRAFQKETPPAARPGGGVQETWADGIASVVHGQHGVTRITRAEAADADLVAVTCHDRSDYRRLEGRGTTVEGIVVVAGDLGAAQRAR